MKSDRDAMIKWAPYQSLTEQATVLARMRYKKNQIPRPRISMDQAEEINEILCSYHGETVKAKYWKDGYLYEIEGTISKIDAQQKILRLEGKEISFLDLIELQRR